MFEDATFDSRAIQPTQTPKWMLLALAVNATLLTSLIVLPLIYPEGLPTRLLQRPIFAPPVQVSARLQPQAVQRTVSIQTLSLRTFDLRPQIPPVTSVDPEPAPSGPITIDTPTDGTTGATRSTTDVFHSQPPAVVHSTQATKVTISAGVSEGLLIFPVRPVYPPIARAARVSGTVVLAATISKTGSIVGLHVLSGPLLLRQATLDAVQQWRYRPYLLNNQPVEVDTTINVVFTLGDR